MPVVEQRLSNFSISSTFSKHEDNKFHWHLWVTVDAAVEHVVDRIVLKGNIAGSKVEFKRSESDPCHFQSPWQRTRGTYTVHVRIVLLENERLEFSHELKLCVGKTHTTHHTATLKVPEKIDEGEEPDSSLTSAVRPPLWCISYQQLMDVEQKARKIFGPEEYPRMTMRDICEKIIQPRCAKKGTSYALSLNKQGLPVGTFVSHSWDGHFAAFVQSIRNIYQTNVIKPNLWICAFALIQGPSEALISQQLGSGEDPLDKSPFVVAIQQAANYCVIRNSQMDVFSRIWCVCELMYARQSKIFPTRTSVTGPDAFASMKTSVLDAKASVLEDRDRILRVLLTEFDRAEVDGIVQLLRNQGTPQYSDETPLPTAQMVTAISLPTQQLEPEASAQPVTSSSMMAPYDIDKYGSKVAREVPNDNEFKKIPTAIPLPTKQLEPEASAQPVTSSSRMVPFDISKYGSKVARKVPNEDEFEKIPNDIHGAVMIHHIRTCDHPGCQTKWRGPWGHFIGGPKGSEYFDLTECEDGRRLNEMIGWDYEDFHR